MKQKIKPFDEFIQDTSPAVAITLRALGKKLNEVIEQINQLYIDDNQPQKDFIPWTCNNCDLTDKDYCLNICSIRNELTQHPLVPRTCLNCAKTKWCQDIDITAIDCLRFKYEK